MAACVEPPIPVALKESEPTPNCGHHHSDEGAIIKDTFSTCIYSLGIPNRRPSISFAFFSTIFHASLN
jgi:hypothetical protein